MVMAALEPTILTAVLDVSPPGWNLVRFGVFVEFTSEQTESVEEHLLSLRFLV